MARFARIRDESGIAMITVILASAIGFMLVSTVVVRGSADLGRARDDRTWEQALHVAEAGLDHALYELAEDATYTTGEAVPASFASEQAEVDWVEENVADNVKGEVVGGQWMLLVPSNEEVVYALGFIPDIGEDAVRRLIRAEYDFAPFQPESALLTDGDLRISGNPTVDGTGGSAHANGNVTMTGNPSFDGYVAASGSYSVSGNPTIGDPANSGGGKPARDVPDVDPREQYDFSHFDLCPDGRVMAGPAFTGPGANTTPTPCLGAELADATSNTYRGWKWTGDDASQGAKWDYSGNTAYDGIYYVYQGSAKVSGNPGSLANPWRVSIIAEADAGGGEPHCPHRGGDIDVSGNPSISTHPDAQPLLLVAGRDVQLSGNPTSGFDGVIAAHEQFKINGNPELVGVVMASDVCDTDSSQVHDSEISGNPHITYSGGWELPSGELIRVTLWLEL